MCYAIFRNLLSLSALFFDPSSTPRDEETKNFDPPLIGLPWFLEVVIRANIADQLLAKSEFIFPLLSSAIKLIHVLILHGCRDHRPPPLLGNFAEP